MLMPTDLSLLRIFVRDVGSGETQIEWFDSENGDCIYRVKTSQLNSAANEVRVSLQKYLRCYIQSRDNAKTKSALRTLVHAGNNLFKSLFLGITNASQAQAALDKYQELDSAGSLKLVLKVDPTWMIPWSLLVPEDVREPADGFNFDELDRLFWCLRHDLSISTFGAGIARRNSIKANELCTIAMMNKSIYDDTNESLETDIEKHWADTVFDPQVCNVTFDSLQFDSVLSKMSELNDVQLRFAYFLGHANGEKFQFSEDDEISANMLAVKLSSNTGGRAYQPTILFLNGCETAAEGEFFSFNQLVGSYVAGLIGTEVKVPDRFAFRFALALLHLVLREGWTLREALTKLRRKHLPISLAYSLYSADGLKIMPSSSDSAFSAGIEREDNYSMGKVTCKS